MKTGSVIPWATMTIEYAFDMNPLRPSADFVGSSVPSLRRYMAWKTHSQYRIAHKKPAAGYEDFLHAGNCSDAAAYRTLIRPTAKIFDGTSEY